MGHINQISIS